MFEIVSDALPGSKSSRWLSAVAVLVAVWVVTRFAMEEDLSWFPWALAGIGLLALAFARWPYGALSIVLVTSAMPRFFVELFGWKARPEHLAGAVVLLALGLELLLCNKSRVELKQLDYWVLAYVVVNYVSSAFGSSSPSDTLRWALQSNLAVAPYFLIRWLARDIRTLTRIFQIFLAVGFAESLYGILCITSYRAFGTTTGMEIGQYGEIAAPYGSLYEPNLFGAYTASCAVVFLALYLVATRHRLLHLVCFSTASLAAFLSFSRAALLAFLVAVGWVFWKARRLKTPRGNQRKTFAWGILLIAALATVGTSAVLRERFKDLFDQGLSEETTITRLLSIQEALQEIPEHLLLGSGTASLQLSFSWAKYLPEWESERTWVGNVTIRILHDSGVIGFSICLGFIVCLWLKIRSGLSAWSSQTPLLLGLAGGAVLYATSFQSTDGTILSFSWVHLGLLASVVSVMNGPAQNIARQEQHEKSR
jgi:hypothetical protein